MAFLPEDSTVDARTIYAKPFPKSTTDEHVKELFGVYGSIRRVKLRREAPTNSFRGSVYIEFTHAASAHAAVSSPPQQPHSGPGVTHRFYVMMKAEYERKRANATSSGGGKGDDSGGGGGSGNGSGHKRARHRSEGPASSSHRKPPQLPPPPPPPPPRDQHGMTPVSEHHNHNQQWQKIVEEREATVRALEESLRKEREDNQRLYQRLEEVQQLAQEAVTREAAANQKVLAREVEIGSLKGEVAMLRTQGAAQLERQSTAHKARVSEMEASLQRLKDALLGKERGEREMKKAVAIGKGEGWARRIGGASSGNDGGGLDDL